ncbi:hypothetical protein [Terriglobus sp. TAA 43]|uniref:hypothetical protein n=1 Tax=Terriglobus sp. TAA 43 TaxID=278961 RepID=UPI0006455E48|nr:hypothetical protein [Terriglobus sp. TAA 43]
MRFSAWMTAAFLVTATLHGQQTTPVTRNDLPPSTVLSDSLTLFDRIRSDMANWSEVELAAFQTTVVQAKDDCNRIEHTAHEGDEELALARLCALGRDWDGTYSAARWYTRREALPANSQHLVAGFALLLQADLNLQQVARAIDELQEMHKRLPYTAETDGIFTYAINALEIMRPEQGITAAMLRQPDLLTAVAGKNTTLTPGISEAEAWHTLALLHAAGRKDEEQTQKSLLLESIAQRSAPLSTTDQYTAQRARTRYEWLSQTAPAFAITRGTYPPMPHRPPSSTKSTLLVIENATAADVPALSLAVDSLRTRLAPGQQASLVLIGTPPLTSAKRDPHEPVIHAQYTSAPLLENFATDGGSLFVFLDSANRVTWFGTGTPAWLNPQQQAEILLQKASAP